MVIVYLFIFPSTRRRLQIATDINSSTPPLEAMNHFSGQSRGGKATHKREDPKEKEKDRFHDEKVMEAEEKEATAKGGATGRDNDFIQVFNNSDEEIKSAAEVASTQFLILFKRPYNHDDEEGDKDEVPAPTRAISEDNGDNSSSIINRSSTPLPPSFPHHRALSFDASQLVSPSSLSTSKNRDGNREGEGGEGEGGGNKGEEKTEKVVERDAAEQCGSPKVHDEGSSVAPSSQSSSPPSPLFSSTASSHQNDSLA